MTVTETDRRRAALGLGAAAFALAAAPKAVGQIAGVEVLATGAPGEGQDQLARAVAEGLAITRLTPKAVAVNLPRDAEALKDFAVGKRPRAGLMIVGLSTLGVLEVGGAASNLDGCRPLARMVGEHLPVVTPVGSPIRSLADLMTALRADSSSVSWAGRAKGSADHQLCLLLTKAAGGDVSRVGYRQFDTSARASSEVLTGKATIATGALLDFLQQTRGGTLRALAVASPARVPGVDVPTLKEQGVDVTTLNWRGVVTRDAIGRGMIERYGEALKRLTQAVGWRQLLDQRHWDDIYLSHEEFDRFLTLERARVAALFKSAGPI